MITAEIFFISLAFDGILAKYIVFITLSMWDNKRQVTFPGLYGETSCS